MRLIIFEDHKRQFFHPLALARPVFELRCGMTTLAEKIVERFGRGPAAYFVEPYLTETFARRATGPVNDPGTLRDDDLLLVNGRAIGHTLDVEPIGPSEMCLRGDAVVYARIARADIPSGPFRSPGELLTAVRNRLPVVQSGARVLDSIWELMLASPAMIAEDFARRERCGVEGRVEQPAAIRGTPQDIYIAPGAAIHPFVCLDATHGPIYIAENVEVQSFTRIEGPAYIGPGTILYGAKIREGCSIGPVCRIGGEVEEAVVHGHSNKYHEGFLGHSYIGEWVNLGALTTTSDLKNDYGPVSVTLGGQRHETGSAKIGSFIGDHAKLGIGSLLNSGSMIGAMTLAVTSGPLLPKNIPSFCWYHKGRLSEGRGKEAFYDTARMAMGRRKMQFDEADRRLYDHVYRITADERAAEIQKSEIPSTKSETNSNPEKQQ